MWVWVRIMFILKSNHNNNCDAWLKGIACNCLLITGNMMGMVIDTAGSGLNPVADLVGRILIYQYIIRLSSWQW